MSLESMYGSGSKFLKAADLLDPETKKYRKIDVIISKWELSEMPARDGEPAKKQVLLYFKNLAEALGLDDDDDKKLGVNATNLKSLAANFDLNLKAENEKAELNKLIGATIRLYKGTARNPQGGEVPTIKISEEIFELPKRSAAVASDDDEDESPAPPKKAPVKAKLKADDSDIPF